MLLLSTVHRAEVGVADERDEDEEQDEEPHIKPKVVLDSNHHMKEVDNFDQNLGYYSFNQMTIKWWRRMAMHLIHLAKVQSYILYRDSVRSPVSQYDYTKQLIQQLVHGVPMKQKQSRKTPPEIERLSSVNLFCV